MSMRLGDIAAYTGTEIRGDADVVIDGVMPFELAGEGDIAVAATPKFVKMADQCQAAALVVPADFKGDSKANLLLADSPMAAFADIMQLFAPKPVRFQGVHPTAVIGDEVRLGKNVSVGSCVVVEDGAEVGDDCTLMAGVFIGRNVTIGAGSFLHPRACVLAGCRLGERVVINAGAVIGSDGFGFAPDKQGVYHKIPHLGTVHIANDVEVGANATIDRATFGETVIDNGVKLDNLVHIAHNVRIGEHTVIAAQTGVAGSTTIGRNVMFGGQVGVGGHIKIADRVMAGATAAIGQSVDTPGEILMSGMNAMPHRQWLRYQRIARNLPDLKARVDRLERELKGKNE